MSEYDETGALNPVRPTQYRVERLFYFENGDVVRQVQILETGTEWEETN